MQWKSTQDLKELTNENIFSKSRQHNSTKLKHILENIKQIQQGEIGLARFNIFVTYTSSKTKIFNKIKQLPASLRIISQKS